MYIYINIYIIIFIVITLYNNSYKHSIIINRLIKKKKCVYLFLFKTFLFLKNRYTKKKRLTKKQRACRESAIVGQVEDEGGAVSRGSV